MNVKPFEKKYFEQIVNIHKKHFLNEFSLEDIFNDKILNQFIVIDDYDGVINYGGIKLLFELVLVTDLDRTVRDRVNSLKIFLNSAINTAKKKELEQLHCFVTHDIDKWSNMLETVGFSQTKGRSLYMNL